MVQPSSHIHAGQVISRQHCVPLCQPRAITLPAEARLQRPGWHPATCGCMHGLACARIRPRLDNGGVPQERKVTPAVFYVMIHVRICWPCMVAVQTSGLLGMRLSRGQTTLAYTQTPLTEHHCLKSSRFRGISCIVLTRVASASRTLCALNGSSGPGTTFLGRGMVNL